MPPAGLGGGGLPITPIREGIVRTGLLVYYKGVGISQVQVYERVGHRNLSFRCNVNGN